MAKSRSARPRAAKPRGDMRARIVEAAREILARDGYEKASIREIAKQAGVARGLLHYYFETKEELLVAVAQAAAGDFGRKMAELRERVGGPELGGAAFDLHRDRVAGDPSWYRLRYDLFALALHKPAFRDEVAQLLRDARAGITAGLVRSNAGRDAARNDALAAILAACFDGLALQKLVDPAFDLDRAYDELWRVASAVTASDP
jgi:AcrR family transcriptional regulator